MHFIFRRAFPALTNSKFPFVATPSFDCHGVEKTIYMKYKLVTVPRKNSKASLFYKLCSCSLLPLRRKLLCCPSESVSE